MYNAIELRTTVLASDAQQIDAPKTSTENSGPLFLESLRRARAEASEREDSTQREDFLVLQREPVILRLEFLQEKLAAILIDHKKPYEFFDLSVDDGDHPRLFLDPVAFVDLDQDGRTYRFIRESRLGRTTILKSQEIAPMAQAIIDYIARRVVEQARIAGRLASAPSIEPISDPIPHLHAAAAEAQPNPAEAEHEAFQSNFRPGGKRSEGIRMRLRRAKQTAPQEIEKTSRKQRPSPGPAHKPASIGGPWRRIWAKKAKKTAAPINFNAWRFGFAKAAVEVILELVMMAALVSALVYAVLAIAKTKGY